MRALKSAVPLPRSFWSPTRSPNHIGKKNNPRAKYNDCLKQGLTNFGKNQSCFAAWATGQESESDRPEVPVAAGTVLKVRQGLRRLIWEAFGACAGWKSDNRRLGRISARLDRPLFLKFGQPLSTLLDIFVKSTQYESKQRYEDQAHPSVQNQCLPNGTIQRCPCECRDGQWSETGEAPVNAMQSLVRFHQHAFSILAPMGTLTNNVYIKPVW